MAAWAAARAEETPAPLRSRPRVAKRQHRVTGGAFWIGIVATLLAGVVATNVAVLRLNMKLDRLEIWDRAAWRDQLKEVMGSAEHVAERLAAQHN